MCDPGLLAEVSEWVRSGFGFAAEVHPLPGERDWNFLVTDPATERRYVLKVFAEGESPGFVDAEVAVQRRLAEQGLPVPEVIASGSGSAVLPFGRTNRLARMVTWLPGRPLAGQKHLPDLFWHHLGRTVGRVCLALRGFDHPAVHRRFAWDLANAEQQILQDLNRIDCSRLRGDLQRMLDEAGPVRAASRDDLAQSLIHGDLNDHNLLVSRRFDLPEENVSLSGIIDFGDMVWSRTIHELAVAIAYAVLDRDDPLWIARQMVAGCAEIHPLSTAETEVLWHLVRLRLGLSAAMAARQQESDPENGYLAVSQAPLRRTLPLLLAIPGRFAEAAFREAAGLPPLACFARTADWLSRTIGGGIAAGGFSGNPPDSGTVRLPQGPLPRIDWSVTSPLIGGDPQGIHAQIESRTVGILEDSPGGFGIGAWGEPRLVYQSPQFEACPAVRRRTVHLGLDLVAPAGTGIYALADGTIHDLAVIDLPLDYGGVLMIHYPDREDGGVFVLYGHLSPASLEGKKKSDPVRRGERIAWLGERHENGGWLPHLHLQVMADGLDLGCGFPGVCAARWQDLWLKFCPNPGPLLAQPDSVTDGRAADTATLVDRRRTLIGRSVRLSYSSPLQIARGWKQYLYDQSGRRFLDAYNNVPHVGHCHPRVVEAASRQMGILASNTRYVSRLQTDFAERLLATFPEPLDVCFLLNSASEANELALRLARAASGGRDMIVTEHAYHGHTSSLIDLSPYKHNGPGGSGPAEWVQTIPIADTFRGVYPATDRDAGKKYARFADAAIGRIHDRGSRLAGFIAETCPSVGGQVIFPEDYFRHLYPRIRAAGGICIADEVQTGYGRMGDCFYAFQSHGVVPDVVVLGKPIGNGHPLAAVVTTREIAAAFDSGMEFFSTFGGNHVSCAAGLAVLEVLETESLQARAQQTGILLGQQLHAAIGNHPLVGEIRGRGLFWGIELVRAKETLEPARHEAAWVCNRMRDQGILIGTDGPHHNVLKIRPPMPFDGPNADQLAASLADVLDVLTR